CRCPKERKSDNRLRQKVHLPKTKKPEVNFGLFFI
ncbi:MAG: hypothetical protein ACJAZR_001651, partial [Sediminicola sp.]